MIIWLNGAFGSGKTQTAYELHRRLSDSYVYDPENAGFFIRKNLPQSIHVDDFQDYPMWRKFNLDMLCYISQHYSGPIIVPMTVTDRGYYDELIGALAEKYELRHFILWAQPDTIRRRLASRLEGPDSWAARQLDRCIQAFETDITQHKICTDGLSIEQVAEEAAALAGVSLAADRRSRLHKRLDRAITQFRHIR